MLRPRLLAAALGLLALAPALAACGGEDEIQVGTVVQAREDSQFTETGTAASITLPLGRLEITTDEPTRTIAKNQNRRLEAVDAPSGSTFIPITWQYDASTFGDYADYLQTTDTPVVDLVAGGARYRLAAPESTGEGAESFYVLVGGDGEDAQLDVDFDGVTQTVDLATGERDTGRAEPLYALKPRKERTHSCSAGAVFDTSDLARVAGVGCTVTRTTNLPYAGGEWAAEGKTWLAVTVTTSVARYDEFAKDLKSGAIYTPTKVTSTFTAGKLKPSTVVEDTKKTDCPNTSTGGCKTVYHLLFAIDPDKAPKRMTIQQTYTQTLFSVWGNGESKDEVTVKGTMRVPLR